MGKGQEGRIKGVESTQLWTDIWTMSPVELDPLQGGRGGNWRGTENEIEAQEAKRGTKRHRRHRNERNKQGEEEGETWLPRPKARQACL